MTLTNILIFKSDSNIYDMTRINSMNKLSENNTFIVLIGVIYSYSRVHLRVCVFAL